MQLDLLIIFLSILFSAFFSGLEIAFVSANKLHIELEKKRAGWVPLILKRLTEKSSKFITTMLVGNNISLVIFSFFMGRFVMDFLTPFFPMLLKNDLLALIVQTVVSTFVILITAEFLPKAIFRIYANEALRLFAIPAYFFYLLFYYISDLITAISDWFLTTFFNADELKSQTEFSKEELGDYITEQMDASDANNNVDSEIQIFQNALEFHKVKAREIMVPRTEITAVEIHESISNLKNLFVETGLSKIIVYKTSLDDVLGYIHVSELFKKPKSIKSVLMPVEFVPESIAINDVMNVLTIKRKSIALVLDEYGGTSGLITVEDVIEELFGEIEDEHDSLELTERKHSDTEFTFSARLEIDYLNEAYRLNFPKQEGYETLGGLVLEHTESIPKKGSILRIEPYEIEVVKCSKSRIDELLVKIISAP